MEIQKSFKMANVSKVWLDGHDALVNYTDTAKAPCKDFYHVFVTPSEVIFRYWKIVPPTRANSSFPPIEIRDSCVDFLHDDRCHSEVERLAGHNTLKYLIRMAEGDVDYLYRLPDTVLKNIILMVDLEDLVRLGSTCKKFRALCNSDDVWEKIFRREYETPITAELEQLACKESWKRLFYTNKLQLQLVHTLEDSFYPIFMKLGQNVALIDISAKFDNGSCLRQIKLIHNYFYWPKARRAYMMMHLRRQKRQDQAFVTEEADEDDEQQLNVD